MNHHGKQINHGKDHNESIMKQIQRLERQVMQNMKILNTYENLEQNENRHAVEPSTGQVVEEFIRAYLNYRNYYYYYYTLNCGMIKAIKGQIFTVPSFSIHIALKS